MQDSPISTLNHAETENPMSGNVCLRPVAAGDFDLFEAEVLSPEGAGQFEWFGFTPGHWLRRRFAEDGLLNSEGGFLSITEDDALVGLVNWHKMAWGRPDTSYCWTVAMGLRPSSRSRGIGTAALRMIVAYLFHHTCAQRVQGYTDVENIAAHRILDKSGFQREGVMRSAQWRAGAWHDMALYSVTRETYQAGRRS